jgi:hypothetical protein
MSDVLKGRILGSALEADLQADVRYDSEAREVKMVYARRDISGRAVVSRIHRVKLSADPVDLSNSKLVEEKSGELLEFFTAMVENRYPTPAQLDYLQRALPVGKRAMEDACKRSRCLCELCMSLGCAEYISTKKMETLKIFTRLKAALTRAVGFDAVNAVLEDRHRRPEEGF